MSMTIAPYATPHVPYCRYFGLTLITLLAITCITLGACKYSGLNTIGDSATLMMSGLCILVLEAVLIVKTRPSPSVLSYAEYEKYRRYLRKGEYFIYQGNEKHNYQEMLFTKLSNRNYIIKASSNNISKLLKKVTLSELQKRSYSHWIGWL